MKYFLLSVVVILFSLNMKGQDFNSYFIDKTLRLDYIFSGNDTQSRIVLDQLSQLPRWGGRRGNLDKLARDGNVQLIVTDSASGLCIYKDSFSTLFQEWQMTEEAGNIEKGFENTFLMPYPQNKIIVEIRLRNKNGSYATAMKHVVDPADILIQKKGYSDDIPSYTMLHNGGDIDKCINVVILAEGYTKNEMGKFKEKAQAACRQILAHSPFDKMKDRFNFLAVETVSTDSGVSVPRAGKWKDTAFGSHFDTFYSERYLTSKNVKTIHDAIVGIPYSHIIILANTDVYGGGGIFNMYTLTTTGHPSFDPVVVHEFGHSFGGLADEYFYESKDVFNDTYPMEVEPWEPNITTLTDFDKKWKSMLPDEIPVPTPLELSEKYTIGVYEGAGYSAKGIYRPAYDCRMKTNTCKNFCPACQKAIEQLIKFYTE